MASKNRDDFPAAVKRALAERVAWHCSICLRYTIGPHSDNSKSLKSGHAAHICGAAPGPGGARYDANQTPEQRKSAENGIWACKDCGDQIDKDEDRFKVPWLLKRKADIEKAIDDGRRAGFLEGHRLLAAFASLSEFADSVSLENAITSNHAWISEVFAHQAQARRYFGQSLAPAAKHPYKVLKRQGVVNGIAGALKVQSQAVVAVLGEEGVGKSWALAKALVQWKDRPLVVFVSSKDIKATPSYSQILDQLIEQLVIQSGERQTEAIRTFWQHQFDTWALEVALAPRLIVCIDGLNENTAVDWPRWINGASADLSRIGGRLVVTDRERHFEQKIKDGLASPVATVRVGTWSREELEILLEGRGVNIDDLIPEVHRSLQNPRLLGIALARADVALHELTPQRLLFEYLRQSQAENRLGENPAQFSRRLADHAENIRAKALLQRTTGLGQFDVRDIDGSPSFSLSVDLLHASSSHFYTQLASPSQYRLSNDGLIVAFGIGLVTALTERTTGQKTAAEALESLLEPIEALDMTADAVFAAMQFAAVEAVTPSVQVALLGRFLQLQNIDSKIYPAFVAVARTSPDISLQALYEIDRGNGRPSAKNWLISALRDARDDGATWIQIKRRVDSWLRIYSLDAQLQMPGFLNQPNAEERLKTQRIKQKAKERGLTAPERSFLDANCERNDNFDASALAKDAFLLIAGRPLQEFGTALSAWAFHHALAPAWDAPSDDFQALIQFNTQDWQATSDALRQAVRNLVPGPLSETGQWCLATLWGAIATDLADRERQPLLDVLRPDRHQFRGSRLVEKLSSTDPCDPHSSRPDDLTFLTETAEKQDFSQIYQNRQGKNPVLRAAEPALCRWLPVLAVDTERRLADHVLQYDLPGLGLAMSEISSETAVLDDSAVRRLEDVARRFSQSEYGKSSAEHDAWRASNFALAAAVPHLSADEQFKLLDSLPQPGSLIITTAEMFGKIDAATFEQAYLRAHSSNSFDKMTTYLCFAAYSETPLSRRVQDILVDQALTECDVTYLAIIVLAWHGSADAQKRFTDSGWRASEIKDKSKRQEAFYGSLILINAAQREGLDPLDLLPRIEPSAFDYAARKLGDKIAGPLTQLLASCVSRLANAKLPDVTPPASRLISSDDALSHSHIDVELYESAQSLKDSLDRASESDAEFQARVESADLRFRNFEDGLEKLDAREVIENLGREPVRLAARFSPDQVRDWASICIRAPSAKRPQLANLALTIGSGLTENDETLAVSLFETYADVQPTLQLTFDLRALPHAEIATWTGTGGPLLSAWRSRRLDEAPNDQAIAQSIDGALYNGQDEFLRGYVESGVRSVIPAVRARAVIVAGFMDQAEWIDELFARLEPELGLVRVALDSARYAYERNTWSKHWFTQMCTTSSKAVFWRYSKIFLKIVDFRFEYWARSHVEKATIWNQFSPDLKSKLQSRIKSWKEFRAKTLLGQKVPDPRYIRQN